MSTVLYLCKNASTSPPVSTRMVPAIQYTRIAGGSYWFEFHHMTTSRGSSASSISGATVAGPTSGVELTGLYQGPYLFFVSPPLAADTTISGTISGNIRASESSMSANVTVGFRIFRWSGLDGSLTLIGTTDTTAGTEVGTGETVIYPQITNPNTTLHRGDRLICMPYADDASGTTMASGYSWQLYTNGTSAGTTGDTYITFTENLTFESAPAGTTVYLTNTSAGINPGSATEYEAWTSRGSGVQSAVTNTANGPTSGIQVTATAGGTAVEWYTKPLQAMTLSGPVLVHFRGAAGTNSAGLRCEISVCNGDGTSPVVWGTNQAGNDTTNNAYTKLTTTESAGDFWVSGDDTSIADGKRLLIRFYVDDASATLATGYTATLYYAGSAGATGDTYLTFSNTLAEYSGATTYQNTFSAAANIKRTYEVTSISADAVIKKLDSGPYTFSAESWMVNRVSVTTTTADAVIKKLDIPGSPFTAEANIKRTYEPTFSADAVVKKLDITPDPFTADAVIKKLDITPTPFSADAVLLKLGSEITFAAESTIQKTYEPTFTGEAVISRTYEPTFSAESVIAKVNSTDFSAESFIEPPYGTNWSYTWSNSFGSVTTYSETFSAEAVIQKNISGTFSADSVLKRTDINGAFTAEALISKVFSQTFSADSVVQKTQDGTFGADAWLGKIYSSTFSADATIRRTYSTDFSAEAWMVKNNPNTFSADSVVKKLDNLGSFSADSVMKKVDITTNFNAESVIKKTIGPTNFSADAVIYKTFPLTFSADANIKGTIEGTFSAEARIVTVGTFTFAADAVLKQIDIGGSFSAESYIAKRYDLTFSADATIKRTYENTFSAEAYIVNVIPGSFTADSVIKKTDIPGSLSADAVIKKLDIGGTFTADATVKKPDIPGTFTADSTVKKTDIGGTFTSDAVIYKPGIGGSFSADSVIQKTIGNTFYADATVKKLDIGGEFSADATVLRTYAPTFSAEATISKVGRIVWTTPASGTAIANQPTFKFMMPAASGNMFFHLELDTVNTFDGASYRSYKSAFDQTGWEYWDGGAWVAMPSTGVPNTYSGNEARFTVPTALSDTVWYRRVRGGV